MIMTEEVSFGGGAVVSMANSKEKIYALTAKGSLHSVDVSAPLAA